MVLLVSNENDSSTSLVMDWLHFYNKSVLRVNSDPMIIKNLNLPNKGEAFFKFNLNGKTYSSKSFISYWHRQGGIRLEVDFELDVELSEVRNEEVYNHLDEEISSLKTSIYSILESKHSLGSKLKSNINKLEVLMLAKAVGLNIPQTNIITNKKSIVKKIHSGKSIITKSISDSPSFKSYQSSSGSESYLIYTEEVKEVIKDNFFPSLIQEKLKKEFELRIFYFNKKCYSMAIFSQLDPQTSVDFRKYNLNKKNRVVPFDLPLKVEKKIMKLMKKLGLNSGSIDMVVTKDEKFVFLEVNPVGQFGMTSFPCNYKIEKQIAKYLSNGKN